MGFMNTRCVTGEVDIWPLRGSPDKYSLPFIRDEETNICLNEVDKLGLIFSDGEHSSTVTSMPLFFM